MKLARAFLVLLAAAPAAAQVPESVEPARIPGYRLLKPGVAAAGQPSPEALAGLKAMGFGTVVNLRLETEKGVAGEKAVVEGQGLRYVSVPVTPEGFGLEDALAVQQVLDDPWTGPVLVHCGSANRVGGVLAVIEARKGRSLDEALSLGRAAGLSSPTMESAVRRVLGAASAPAEAPAAPAPRR